MEILSEVRRSVDSLNSELNQKILKLRHSDSTDGVDVLRQIRRSVVENRHKHGEAFVNQVHEWKREEFGSTLDPKVYDFIVLESYRGDIQNSLIYGLLEIPQLVLEGNFKGVFDLARIYLALNMENSDKLSKQLEFLDRE